MRTLIKDPVAFWLMVVLFAVFVALCLLLDPQHLMRSIPVLFSPLILKLAAYGMLAQIFAVWSQAIATATKNPNNLKWESVNGFLLLQFIGGLLAWWSQMESVFVSMVIAFFGSCYIAVAKLKRTDQSKAKIGPPLYVQLGFVWFGLPAIFIALLKLVTIWWAGTDPVSWAGTATMIVGPLMFFQVRAIWYIAISAVREKDNISGFSLLGQFLLLTLQFSGTILSIHAENVFLGYAMALSLVSTVITISTLLIKRYRWGGLLRPTAYLSAE